MGCGEGFEPYVHESFPEGFTRYKDDVVFLGTRENVGTLWEFHPPDGLRALHTSSEMWVPPNAPLMAVVGNTLYFHEYTRLLKRVGETTSLVYDFSTLGGGSTHLLGVRAAGGFLYITVYLGAGYEL